MAKNRPTWKDSDAPDAKGKFKNLSCGALAKWMIKSRKGGLFFCYVFNRKKNPSYATKMVCTRNKVKKLLNGSKKN